jgi:phage I-like protein
MTYAAFGIHRDLVEEGRDPTSDGYYTEVDKRIREYFPQKFGQTETVQQRVAGSSRGTGGKRATRSVKLTPSQVAIAKRLGVPLEDYARHVEN